MISVDVHAVLTIIGMLVGAANFVVLMVIRKEAAEQELHVRDWIRAHFAAEPDTGRRLDALDKALEHCAPLGETERRFQQIEEGIGRLSESVARAWHQGPQKDSC